MCFFFALINSKIWVPWHLPCALFLTSTTRFYTSTVQLHRILVVLPAWPQSPALKEERMGNLEADLNLPESSKTWGLSSDAAWGHRVSLGPGRGFSLCCRWNSSILSSGFRWRLVGWEEKSSMFCAVPGTNSFMMQGCRFCFWCFDNENLL